MQAEKLLQNKLFYDCVGSATKLQCKGECDASERRGKENASWEDYNGIYCNLLPLTCGLKILRSFSEIIM